MFSIIVCSIRPDEAERLRKNIEATIGVPFEFIAYDNRGTGKGICQVYNECAENARYDNLCFVHEDVEFATENWGKLIAEKLSEKDCGVIGFAGSTIKSKAYSGWSSSSHSTMRTNYIRLYKGKEQLRNINPLGEDFSEVIAIDGLCLLCRKDTWRTIRFDDILLKSFHCYDIDFAIANRIAGNKNYVCHTVLVKHFSNGNYDMNWWRESKKMHKKWEKHLPLYIEYPSELRKKYIEYRSNIEITQALGKNGIFVGSPQKYIMGYIATHPFNGRSYKLLGKYFNHLRTKQK